MGCSPQTPETNEHDPSLRIASTARVSTASGTPGGIEKRQTVKSVKP